MTKKHVQKNGNKINCQQGWIITVYLRPTASMGSRSSLMSGWMLGPMALESMLIQVNTVASTCMVFWRLQAVKMGQRKVKRMHLLLKWKSTTDICQCQIINQIINNFLSTFKSRIQGISTTGLIFPRTYLLNIKSTKHNFTL